MKNILVATDFSAPAENAVRYALELAKKTKASITLFHAYIIPIPVMEAPVIVVTGEEMEKISMEGLKKIKDKISSEFPDLLIECVSKAGLAADRISDVVLEKNCDFVIMGIQGAGKVIEYLVGSATTDYIRKAKVPVLAIPENAVFKTPERIAFAWDYKGEVNKSMIEPLFEFIRLFRAKLMVINVVNEPDEITVQKAVSGIKLEHLLDNMEHTLHFPVKEGSISDEINSFVKEHRADILAVVPHKHSIMERVFNKSNTKKMVFHSDVPLLAIPEKI